MELKTLSAYNNTKKINFGDVVVIYKFGGNWCAPCKKVEEVINDTPGTLLYNISVDNEEFESHLIENNIYTIPHCFLYCRNETIDFKGEITRDELEKLCKSLKHAAGVDS